MPTAPLCPRDGFVKEVLLDHVITQTTTIFFDFRGYLYDYLKLFILDGHIIQRLSS